MTIFFKSYHFLIVSLLLTLSVCHKDNVTTAPDLNGIAEIDRDHFIKNYNQCNINNDKYDCNCVARVQVDHRNENFTKYKAEYEMIHKPRLAAEIDALARKLAMDSKNNDDERQLESMELTLEELREKLKHGVNSINIYNIPALPPSATDHCIID